MAAAFRLGAAIALLILGPTCAWVRAQCLDQSFGTLEKQGYTVGTVRLTGAFLAGGGLSNVVATHVVPGRPLTRSAVEAGREALASTIRETPTLFDPLVSATVVAAEVPSCDAIARRADVVYKVFTTKIGRSLGRTFESAAADAADPAARLGAGPSPLRFQVVPSVRFDSLERVVGGAHGWVTLGRVFDRLEAAVEGSSEIVNTDVDLAGSRERDAALMRLLEWRVGYHRHERLTGTESPQTAATDLTTQLVVAQGMAVTRPLGTMGSVFRFASAIEAGQQKGEVATGSVEPGLLDESGGGSWKGAAGITIRSRRHDFRGSFGLQLGLTRGAGAIDYVKSVADVAYTGRIPAGSHRVLEIASQVGLGGLTGDDGVPVTERFFGGSAAVPFLVGDDWAFHATPGLRSFAASSFAGGGNGGTSYQSLNVTASLPVWLRPLVPAEVASDADVRKQLDTQLDSGEQILETAYRVPDPAHVRAVAVATGPLLMQLAALRTRLAELLPLVPAEMKDTAEACDEQSDTLLATVEGITMRTYVGFLLAEPVDEDDATLSSVIKVCITDLNARLSDASLAGTGVQLRASRQGIADAISQIDVVKSRARAKDDMVFARQSVGIVLDELNAVSVGPVVIFDVARLAQATPTPLAQTRYGLGGGVRLSLASTLHFDAGYTWNVNRAAGERRGAAFAALEISTVFGD